MTRLDRSSLSRRDYLRAAVAVGGAAGLSACLGESDSEIPTGTGDPDELPDRQHAWNDALPTDADGNVRPPEHHVLAACSLADEGAPSEAARETLSETFRALERAYEWSNEGLLFTVGYSPAYFERFDDRDPAGVDLPAPEALTDREEPAFDEFDALIHLASDHPGVPLAVEAALSGDRDELNGVDLEVDPSTVLDVHEDERRTGFVGPGLPAERADESGVPGSVPDDAPFFMGFRSGFRESQATEDRVTIAEGPFAGGTTQHVSSMDLQLETWYGQESHAQRVAKAFSPVHADEDRVGEVGERLSTSTDVTADRIGAAEDHAAEYGVVGHAQKAARAREDGEPLLLRRDFNTIDGGGPGVHFVSLQGAVGEFVRVREAMTGGDLAGRGVGETVDNGLLQYLFVTRRGNFLLPPRDRRALPEADPGSVGQASDRGGGTT